LDETLQNINSDYKAKRFKDMVIKKPVIREIPRGTFYKWFKNNNKLGGQNKIRRLSNDRDIVEEIYNIVK
ncbi:MAG: GH3 auxin-responsive promoter family protein, partial [Bacteroidales bacterium]|nr:GH3 auxin-responsive promoter family protein [Bacteroidales bacterium]MDD3152430.1 GH3 auxin-responsive promoter family protein [Bacteroidales bacterium]MDD4634965.1 GH3 auxin-responsive promoter family protein [Bacteroidales bacterium]